MKTVKIFKLIFRAFFYIFTVDLDRRKHKLIFLIVPILKSPLSKCSMPLQPHPPLVPYPLRSPCPSRALPATIDVDKLFRQSNIYDHGCE